MAELTVEDGCLRATGDSGQSGSGSRPSLLLVLPDGFGWREEAGAILISDRMDEVVARVGDTVRLSGRLIDADSDLAHEIADGAPEACAGPYYMVGDDVSVIGRDEPEVVPVPGSTLYFERLRTRMLSPDMVDTLDLMPSVPMQLTLDGDCLLVSEQADGSEGRMVVWPAGFYPHIGEDGVIEVRNGGGRTIARVGDGLYMRGRETPATDVHTLRCGVETLWTVNNLRNADFPLVFSRHQ